MDALLVDVAVEERAFGCVHHRAGAADEPGIDLSGIADQMIDRLVAAGAVEHSVEQVDVALFLGEEMVERQATDVAVLQVRELLEKDDRAAVAISVEQGELAAGLFFKGGLEQRHDRGDPGAAGNSDDVASCLARELGRERPVGRHHLDRIAGLELVADPV